VRYGLHLYPQCRLIVILQSVYTYQVPYLGVTVIALRGKFTQKWLKSRTAQPLAIYCLSKSERLAANIQLTLHKALIRSAITCLSWLGICGKRPPFWKCRVCTRWRTATRELHVSFKILYIRGSTTNCTGSKDKSHNIVTMLMIVTLDRARPSAGNIKAWDWSAVRLATVRVTEPSLQQQLSKAWDYQLHKVKVMLLSVSTSWRRIEVTGLQLHSFLTSALFGPWWSV